MCVAFSLVYSMYLKSLRYWMRCPNCKGKFFLNVMLEENFMCFWRVMLGILKVCVEQTMYHKPSFAEQYAFPLSSYHSGDCSRLGKISPSWNHRASEFQSPFLSAFSSGLSFLSAVLPCACSCAIVLVNGLWWRKPLDSQGWQTWALFFFTQVFCHLLLL